MTVAIDVTKIEPVTGDREGHEDASAYAAVETNLSGADASPTQTATRCGSGAVRRIVTLYSSRWGIENTYNG
jgi:hypothetical protein